MEFENRNIPPSQTINEERSFAKYFLLSLVTLSLYSLWFAATIGKDINTIASAYDGKRTMNFMWLAVPLIILSMLMGGLLVWVVALTYDALSMDDVFVSYAADPFTLLIASLLLMAVSVSVLVYLVSMYVWTYRVTKRIVNELQRRQLSAAFAVRDFWIWYLAASFIFALPAEFVDGVASYLMMALSFIGPLVYVYKLITAINTLAKDYNSNG